MKDSTKFSTRISLLKSELTKHKIDFFFLPNSDEFFSEYLQESEKRIQYLSGFSGSNACVIFSAKKSYFFTDGRYLLQAKNELDLSEFEIIDITTTSVVSWLKRNLKKGNLLALQEKLSSVNFVESCLKIAEKNEAKVDLIENDLVEKIWRERPARKNSPIFFLGEGVCGESSAIKRERILKNDELELGDPSPDAMLISKPENLCWLTNARASDLEFTPLALTYGILFKNGNLDFFTDEKRFTDATELEKQRINAISADCFDLRISALKKTVKKIQIDPNTTNYWLYRLLEKNGSEIILAKDPIDLMKSCKNSAEIKSLTKAHELDGLAVIKFLFWLKKSFKERREIDEISASEKLLELRQSSPTFVCPSFAAISAFAENGAVIHYNSSPETNKKLAGNSLYLIDSGGQYHGSGACGTTDITRTICVNKPSAEMVENFTLVLKGHVALAMAKFPVGTSGAQLDALARNHLWQAGKDYAHGTGHGVGHFLSVHEGPCNISKRGHQGLLPGMILSNEPGFYAEGKYGIRLENLMLVEPVDEKFLQFRTLTLAPFDPDLIDFAMLEEAEKEWLRAYHCEILERLESGLSQEEIGWMNSVVLRFIRS